MSRTDDSLAQNVPACSSSNLSSEQSSFVYGASFRLREGWTRRVVRLSRRCRPLDYGALYDLGHELASRSHDWEAFERKVDRLCGVSRVVSSKSTLVSPSSSSGSGIPSRRSTCSTQSSEDTSSGWDGPALPIGSAPDSIPPRCITEEVGSWKLNSVSCAEQSMSAISVISSMMDGVAAPALRGEIAKSGDLTVIHQTSIPRTGLVSPHISRRGTLSVLEKVGLPKENPRGGRPAGAVGVYPGGMLIRAVTGREKTGGGPRGVICGFSRGSQRRMLEKLCGIDFSVGPVHFVTLTYHKDWGNAEDWGRHLDAFHAALTREYGGELAGAMWKLEFQEKRWRDRGELVPHYHLLLFWIKAPTVEAVRAWVRSTWNRIAQPGNMTAFWAGTSVDDAYNCSGGLLGCLMQYVGKYMGKVSRKPIDPKTGEIIFPGRWWGKWGEPPAVTLAVAGLGDRAMTYLIRRVRRWGKQFGYLKKARAQSGGRLILGDGCHLRKLLVGLEFDTYPGEGLDIGQVVDRIRLLARPAVVCEGVV